MPYECHGGPEKNGRFKILTSGQTTVKPPRKSTKNPHFPGKREKKTQENTHRARENDFF